MSSALAVLLVEDDEALAGLVERTLHAWHDELTVARTAAEAIDSLRTVDVVLVDLDVQQGGGLALVHLFRARDPGLAIVALTRSGDAEAEAVAHALGVSTTVSKPLTGDAILVALSPIRERKASRSETSARQSLLPLAPVLQALDVRTLATTLAETVRALTEGPARVVLDDPREGEIEARAGVGEATDPLVLTAYDETIGTLYVSAGLDAGRVPELDLVALSAATVGVLLRRVDTVARVGIKDPETSAYTFAYFVDVAGREIERARRYGRRFALLTFLVENYADLRAMATSDGLREARRELVDTILDTVRDTDVVAHVEDDELYLLVPEAGMMGALACRRRIADKQRKRSELARLEGRPTMQLTIGVSTYPRDGRDLTGLLKAAHKRNSAARETLARTLLREVRGAGLEALLGGLLRIRPDDATWQTRQGALASHVIAAMAGSVTREATRGGSGRDGVLYVVGEKNHPLVRGTLASVPGTSVGGAAAYWLRPRASEGRAEPSAAGARMSPVEIEIDGVRVGPFAMVVALTEGWAYACVASEHGDYKRVMHTCELDVVEALLAELQTTFHLQRGLE